LTNEEIAQYQMEIKFISSTLSEMISGD